MDFNGSGTAVTERYLTNPAAYGTLYARVSGTGTADWYITDNLGSIRQIVSTSGSVLDAIVYDAWGNIISESDPSNGDRFKYAGGQYDSIQQTYLFTARWYNPQDERWESQDPLGFKAGDSNLYRYVANRPVDLVDPTGYQPMAEPPPPEIIPGITISGFAIPEEVSYCPPSIRWTMTLTPPKNPRSGFIVQHVVRTEVIYNCFGELLSNKTANFWEAYPINDPENKNLEAWPPYWNDTLGFAGSNDTSGIVRWWVYAVYVTNWRPSPPGPPKFQGRGVSQSPGWYLPGQPGHEPSAISLPTTNTQPPWWKEVGGVWRTLTFFWHCCQICG